MEIRQLLQTVRANWVVALVTFLVCLLLGGAYAELPAKTYSTSVVLLAQPPAGATDPGADVSAIQIEIPQITVEAENPTIDEEARSQVPAHLQSTPVTITAVADPTTNSVTITASSEDPAAAQAFANATAARVVKVTNRDAGSYLALSELGAAQLPTTPTNPRGTVAVAAVAFGLIAAVFVALAVGALRRSTGVDEISKRLGLPVLGRVPTLLHGGSNPADLFQLAGDERGLEAFQQLRSHLYLMFQDTRPVIAFTSCSPREGKSCVASHAAWALATSGQFVVAVDGDLREPTLDEIFNVPLSPGVSDISTASGPSELLAATENRYLELVPAGVPTRHPTDIAAADLPRLFRALQESDRMVVLDCPPITGVAETTILVAKADAVVLVVDARKPDFETLEQGLAQIRESGGNVVGIALNRVRRRTAAADYASLRASGPPSTNGNNRESRGLKHWVDRVRSESPAPVDDALEQSRQG
jgi:capsular exopolysaccharide synthesis family protein